MKAVVLGRMSRRGAPGPLAEIGAELKALEAEIVGLLREVVE